MVSLANLVQKKKTLGGGAQDSNSRPFDNAIPFFEIPAVKGPNG